MPGRKRSHSLVSAAIAFRSAMTTPQSAAFSALSRRKRSSLLVMRPSLLAYLLSEIPNCSAAVAISQRKRHTVQHFPIIALKDVGAPKNTMAKKQTFQSLPECHAALAAGASGGSSVTHE